MTNAGWKTILKYAFGVLALAVSVALAWFLPGWYAGWQDGRMLGRTVTSSRENIAFLDTGSLDIARTLQMMEDSELFELEVADDNLLQASAPDLVNRCRTCIRDWCGANLLPEECLLWVAPEKLTEAVRGILLLDQAALELQLLHFEDYESRESLTVLMGKDPDMLYFVSANGDAVLDMMVSCMGYRSLKEFGMTVGEGVVEGYDSFPYDRYSYGSYSYDGSEEEGRDIIRFLLASEKRDSSLIPDCRFAAVCGAQSETVTRGAGTVEMDVGLAFEVSESHAYRRITNDKTGFGIAVGYGTDRWFDNIGAYPLPDDWYSFAAWYAVGAVDRDTYYYSSMTDEYDYILWWNDPLEAARMYGLDSDVILENLSRLEEDGKLYGAKSPGSEAAGDVEGAGAPEAEAAYDMAYNP